MSQKNLSFLESTHFLLDSSQKIGLKLSETSTLLTGLDEDVANNNREDEDAEDDEDETMEVSSEWMSWSHDSSHELVNRSFL